MPEQPRYFETEADFRSWLVENHDKAGELVVGFWKKSCRRASIDWPQSRDQALCFGWIDGIRRSIDGERYTVRFTPRRRGSIWSRVNIGRYKELKAGGHMTPAGDRAYEENKERSGLYSYENEHKTLTAEETARFRRNKAAWADWEKRPPHYRRAVLYWINGAKRPETRERRLTMLIRDSAAGRKLAPMDITRKK